MIIDETFTVVITIAICSVLIALCAVLIKKEAKSKNRQTEFDERQVLDRKKALSNAFYTLIATEIVYMVLDVTSGITLQNAPLWRMGAILLSLAVFANSCIWLDAYFSIKSTRKGQIVAFICIGLSNVAIFISNFFTNGGIRTIDGNFDPSVINLGTTLLLVSCLVSVGLKKLCDNRNNEKAREAEEHGAKTEQLREANKAQQTEQTHGEPEAEKASGAGSAQPIHGANEAEKASGAGTVQQMYGAKPSDKGVQ